MAIFLILFVALFVIGGPLYLIFGVPSIVGIALGTGSLDIIGVQLTGAMANPEYTALPMFILLGNIMSNTGSGERLISLSVAMFGRLRHSLIFTTVAAGVFFAGAIGASAAEAAILASILAGPMEKHGYPRSFTLGLIASTSVLGVIIPPSTPMIIYSVLAEVSLGDLFLAGIVPGLVIAALILGTALAIAKKYDYGPRAGIAVTVSGANPSPSVATTRTVLRGLPYVAIPFIVIGSIYLGWATATESASISVLYMILLGLLFREFTFANVYQVCRDTARIVGTVMLLIVVIQLFGYVVTLYGITNSLTSFVIGLGLTTGLFLLAMNIVLLIMGIPLDPAPLLFLVVPIVAPILLATGVDPIHFGILMMINIGIALISPPVGLVLYTLVSVTRVATTEVFRAVWPFVGVLVVALLLITYVPWLSLGLIR